MKAENRGSRVLFNGDEIFRENVPAAFILYINGNPVVPGHLENLMETLLDIGPDVVTNEILSPDRMW